MKMSKVNIVLLQFASPVAQDLDRTTLTSRGGGKRQLASLPAASANGRKTRVECGSACELGLRPLTFWVWNNAHFLGKN
jgi:hypothetical protein